MLSSGRHHHRAAPNLRLDSHQPDVRAGPHPLRKLRGAFRGDCAKPGNRTRIRTGCSRSAGDHRRRNSPEYRELGLQRDCSSDRGRVPGRSGLALQKRPRLSRLGRHRRSSDGVLRSWTHGRRLHSASAGHSITRERAMPVPQFLLDLLQLLFALAVPAAFCTLAAAGVSLRHEGGVNFHVNGRTGKWILWTVILLTLPQLLQWIAAQGITVPSASGSVGTSWLVDMETVFTNFVNQIVVAKLVPILAGYFVLKATLDGAAGESPLGSILAALFLMSLSATMQLFEGWNSGGEYAMTDMLGSFWNYIVGRIMPAAAGLACVGAVINYVCHRPCARLIFSAIAFLSVTGLLKLFQAMAA